MVRTLIGILLFSSTIFANDDLGTLQLLEKVSNDVVSVAESISTETELPKLDESAINLSVAQIAKSTKSRLSSDRAYLEQHKELIEDLNSDPRVIISRAAVGVIGFPLAAITAAYTLPTAYIVGAGAYASIGSVVSDYMDIDLIEVSAELKTNVNKSDKLFFIKYLSMQHATLEEHKKTIEVRWYHNMVYSSNPFEDKVRVTSMQVGLNELILKIIATM